MNYEKKPIPKQGGLFYGADYNPDQWQHAPEVLERDIELMKEAGVTSASIGIFAWTARWSPKKVIMNLHGLMQ